MFPNILLVGDEVRSTFQFRVPVDNSHTYHVSYYVWKPAPGTIAPKQETVPYRYVPLKDDEGRWINDILFNQDYLAWVTQGPVAKRHLEKLGESDKGIILFRKLLQQQAQIVSDGGDPMNTFRDPEKNDVIPLPLEHVKFGNRRKMGYTLVEAGVPAVTDIVNETLESWTGERSARGTAGVQKGK